MDGPSRLRRGAEATGGGRLIMVTVRPATAGDIGAIAGLLRAFGRYWNREDWVTGGEVALAEALFGPEPRGFGHVAVADGRVIGVALWYLAYNFWAARPILYLEDLYVDADARGSGAGGALMRALAGEAVARDCVWMNWVVVNADQRAQRFYAGLGAVTDPIATQWRLDGEDCARLAGQG